MRIKHRKTIITITISILHSLSGAVSLLRADTFPCNGLNVTVPFTDVAGNFAFCAIAEIYFQGIGDDLFANQQRHARSDGGLHHADDGSVTQARQPPSGARSVLDTRLRREPRIDCGGWFYGTGQIRRSRSLGGELWFQLSLAGASQ